MVRHLVVGVDPGTTTAVAALDLSGRVVGLHSSKDMGVASVVNFILGLGKPSLIASDVNPAPDFVSTIATCFGVVLIAPQKTLRVEEKLGLTRGFEAADAHQRDALAAALHALDALTRKLDRARSQGLSEEAIHLVLQGNSLSSAKIAVEGKKEEAPTPAEPAQPAKPPTEGDRRLRDLERRVKALQEVATERERRIGELAGELAFARRAAHTKPQTQSTAEKRILSLQVKLTQLRKSEELLERIFSGEALPVGIYPKNIRGLSLVEVRPQNLRGISAAFTSDRKVREELLERGLQVYDAGELLRAGERHYITRQRLRELGEAAGNRTDIEKIVSEYREKRV
jgi:uncharacterized protein